MTADGAAAMPPEVDVVVVGSGCAGLVAALAAARHGATVRLLEAGDEIGGTSALSGGVVWIPNNEQMGKLGCSDSDEEGFRYLVHQAGATADPALVATFVAAGRAAVRFVEEASPLTFDAIDAPDYHPESPGGKVSGRPIEPGLFQPATLGEWAGAILGPPTHVPTRVSESMGKIEEYLAQHAEEMEERRRLGLWARGRALVGGLLAGCLEAGVDVRTGVRGRRLLLDAGRVRGIVCDHGSVVEEHRAGAVVLASGGFDFSAEMTSQLLAGAADISAASRHNDGAALRMAMAAGASFANVSDAWWAPAIARPDEINAPFPMVRQTQAERSRPGSIMVNAAGRRFVNEAANYYDVGRVMHAVDATSGLPANLPAWLVFDHRYRASYVLAGLAPSDADPEWVTSAPSLRELGVRCGIDGAALEATVTAFNDGARAGADPTFGRGVSAYERFVGDRSFDGPAATLRALEEPPFYAVRIQCGILGTNGGPRIDAGGRVVDPWGVAIPGLFAAGNASGSPIGSCYPGFGATLGPALVFGYLAGRTAAGASADEDVDALARQLQH